MPWDRNHAYEISIHALREEGDLVLLAVDVAHGLISIHALREEGDGECPTSAASRVEFLSTPSARRATPALLRYVAFAGISIHALREEGDSKNREKILCFCLIIHLPAQIAKRSL